MKNKLSFLLSVVCLWGVILVSGCSEKDETPTNLTLKEGTQTTQVVYADEVTNQGGISFTALSDWTATVTEVATEAATKAASGKVEWLELSAYSGIRYPQSTTSFVTRFLLPLPIIRNI
jgi:hypothetical protein